MIYCNGKSLIYLITYDRCLKQHVGQTIDEFRYRRNSYEDNPSMFERREDRPKKHWELGVNVGDKNKWHCILFHWICLWTDCIWTMVSGNDFLTFIVSTVVNAIFSVAILAVLLLWFC